jgi:tetratricopeptide (TPR) repeat protein
MTRYRPSLNFLLVSAMVIAATFGSAFSQTPTLSAEGELVRVVQLIHQGKREEALKQIKAIVKNESNAEGHYYLGIVYLQLNDFKKARSAFQTALKLQPTLAASAQAQIAYARVLRGTLKVAEPEARKALEADPYNVDALYTIAFLHIRKGERDEALKHADTLVVVKPDQAEAYLLKSMALVNFNSETAIADQHERLLRYQSAAEALDRYLRLATDPPAAQFWQDQLESLKFYLRVDQPGSTEVYSPRHVTTKFRVIEKPEPSYTDAARAEQVEGRVILRGVVGIDGTIQHVLVIQSLTHGLTEASIAAAKSIKFAPAMLDGKPVPVFVQLEYNFDLF